MIYLDHAAATPVSKKALQKMQPYFSETFFNPSAPYLPAKEVREAYESAKDEIAHCIGAKGTDLVITSGATESINLAFTVVERGQEIGSSGRSSGPSSRASSLSASQGANGPRRNCESPSEPISVLILSTEHASVRETAKQFDYQEIKVKKDGTIDLVDFQEKLNENIQLVSISLANNELGTIQPLAEIAEIIKKERRNRLEKGIKTPIYFHSDASQALNLLDVNVARLGVDLLTLNAAKVGGPKGVGALYVGHGIKLKPITRGGGQERGLRGGTENVPGVIGFAAALEEAKEHIVSNRKKYQEFAKIFEQKFSDNIFPVKHKLENFVTLVFPGLDAERLIYKLESEGVLVSTGAACAASKGEKSHVLTAIGLSDDEIAGSLRISFGVANTKEQIIESTEKIAEAVQQELARIR